MSNSSYVDSARTVLSDPDPGRQNYYGMEMQQLVSRDGPGRDLSYGTLNHVNISINHITIKERKKKTQADWGRNMEQLIAERIQ